MRAKKMPVEPVVTKPSPRDLSADDIDLLGSIRTRFAEAVGDGAPLFTTETVDLWEVFLSHIPAELRQTYTCNACRAFVQRFGGLVTIAEDGRVESAMWGTGPGVFAEAVSALASVVTRGRITGAFMSKDQTWGTPVTGEWHHFSVEIPAAMICRERLKAPREVAAEKREDFLMLGRAVREFPIELVRAAHRIVYADQLPGTEKVKGVADWLRALHERLEGVTQARTRDNILWRAAATAPAGFCHVRNTMIGTLLADLEAGHDFEAVQARWTEKMHPLRYMRPQAAPTAGAIAQAEKTIAALAAAGALNRRFARLEDVQVSIWRPAVDSPPAAQQTAGVFGHLKPKGAAQAQSIELPTQTMTWTKFAATVLPATRKLEFLAARERAPYIALVTAADPEAPPIIQWDSEEKRNPVTPYVYHGGSIPTDFNLAAGEWHEVVMITSPPSQWSGAMSHHGDGAILILKGARDVCYETGGGFFPAHLRSELHGIRSVMEAHVKSQKIAGRDEATACGIFFGTKAIGQRLRVTTSEGVATYKIDRWD